MPQCSFRYQEVALIRKKKVLNLCMQLQLIALRTAGLTKGQTGSFIFYYSLFSLPLRFAATASVFEPIYSSNTYTHTTNDTEIMSTTPFHTDSLETLSLHAGFNPTDDPYGSVNIPLYQNTAFAFPDSKYAADIFALKIGGNIYTRLNNPTTGILENRLAAIEGGIASVVTSCGQSAISTALLSLLASGDHIVASESLYGGTFNLLSHTLPRFGITTTFVNANDPEAVRRAIRPETKLVFTEVVGNPKLDFVDLPRLAAVAHEAGLPLFADNTCTFGLYRPLSEGADVEIISLTKLAAGDGTTLGGAIIDGGAYDWGSGLFPRLTEEDPSYHGVKFAETFGPAAYIYWLVTVGLRDFGACISPFNSLQILKGLETLKLRSEQSSRTALALAEWLAQHPLVKWARYPGLSGHESKSLADEKLPRGAGVIVTFAPKGGYEAAKIVDESTKIFKLVANFGDSKSLIVHPASTTHSQLSREDLENAGVSDDLIRLSIGLEDVEDLKSDLDQALKLAHQ